MRTTLLVVAFAVGCGGGKGGEGPATAPQPSSPRPVTAPPAVDGGLATDAASAEADASVDALAPLALGPPVDLQQLAVLAAGGRGPIELHAADAPVGHLRLAVARLTRVNLLEVSASNLISGRLGPTTTAAARRALADGALGGPTRPFPTKGGAVPIDVDFVAVDRDDLYRVLSHMSRTSIVVAAPGPATIDLVVRRTPTTQVLALLTARLGLTDDRHGSLHWIRAADGPTLDRALLDRAGPRDVTLEVRDATAGEVYALLARLGAITDGAPCEAGTRLQFRVRGAPLGAALAVTAALSGVPPRAGAACTGDPRGADVRDLALRGVAAIGPRRAAVFGHGDRAVTAELGEVFADARVIDLGGAHVVVEDLGTAAPEQRSVQLHPSALAFGSAGPPTDLSPDGSGTAAWVAATVTRGRLAATVIDGGHRAALFELPGPRWEWLDAAILRRLPPNTVRIEPGRVVVQPEQSPFGPELPPIDAVLRAAP